MDPTEVRKSVRQIEGIITSNITPVLIESTYRYYIPFELIVQTMIIQDKTKVGEHEQVPRQTFNQFQSLLLLHHLLLVFDHVLCYVLHVNLPTTTPNPTPGCWLGGVILNVTHVRKPRVGDPDHPPP